MTTAFAALTIPSLIAVVQGQPGFHAISPGTFISILYAGAAVATIVAGTAVESLGAMRTSQLAVLSCAVGLMMATEGSEVSLIAAALALGLGYGPITPASSQLLNAATSARNRRFVFSLKQTGVPAGTALAGALVPVMTVGLGWKPALFVVVAICASVVVGVHPLTSRLVTSPKARVVSRPKWWRAIGVALAHPYLRVLSLAAFVLGGAQMCASAFLASYFFGQVGFTPLRAGAMVTVANVCGAGFRLVWGAVADRGANPRLLLAGLSLAACLAEVVLASPGLMASFPVAAVTCAVLGSVIIGWNGVLLSEIADAVPASQVASATAGCLFFSFGGVMAFPAAFGVIQRLSGSFVVPWSMVAGANALLGVLLLSGMRNPIANSEAKASAVDE
ncbi:MFS transporter [Paraburkholderia youngii]|uniref:MFS transporter n=1 Tax=Paraburkholderia youngii TaxID=2782701 RepID=UPI003D1E739F